ncbi:hypothetical protein [Azospirillum sp. B4]|uniref:hypothetical protein n=1 Tax=Azospirillum sp. B4 TaxID=95605 RepID=UPI00131F11BA|nr:hypothetical protein [Azospirillum sp. B4]
MLDVQVVRGGRSFRLDLYSLLMGDAQGRDIPLAEGDMHRCALADQFRGRHRPGEAPGHL